MSVEQLTPLEETFDNAFRRNFSRFFEPEFAVALRRFLAKGNYCRTFSVSVGVTAVQLVAFNPTRIRVSIFNNGNAAIFYGRPRLVTTGPIGDPNAGFPIAASTGLIIDDTTAEIWAISGSAAMDVRIEEVIGEAI